MKTPLPKNIGKPATSALKINDITCLEELTNINEDTLIDMHGVGPKAVKILKQVLSDNDLSLKE